MSLFSPDEQAQAIADVRALLRAAAVEAMLLRPGTGERLYGADDTLLNEVGPVLVELVRTPAPTLSQGIDATANLLPEAPVQPEDRLRVGTETYRVQTVTDQWLFGALTHREVQLVRLHGS